MGDSSEHDTTEGNRYDDDETHEEHDGRMTTLSEEQPEPLQVLISQPVSGLLGEADELERQGAPLEDLHAFEHRGASLRKKDEAPDSSDKEG